MSKIARLHPQRDNPPAPPTRRREHGERALVRLLAKLLVDDYLRELEQHPKARTEEVKRGE
jgi:hypothetical protein